LASSVGGLPIAAVGSEHGPLDGRSERQTDGEPDK
jgi:hypothetical protein